MVHPIKSALHLEGMTARVLCRRVQLREETLSRVIHGTREISAGTKKRIAETLGQRVEDLFPQEGRRAG